MMVLLSPASGLWFGTNNLPLPGHILIYGPPVSYLRFEVTKMNYCLKGLESYIYRLDIIGMLEEVS